MAGLDGTIIGNCRRSRTKKVTDPLNEDVVRSTLSACSSSSSSSSSVDLSEEEEDVLFLSEEVAGRSKCGRARCNCYEGQSCLQISDSDSDDDGEDEIKELQEIFSSSFTEAEKAIEKAVYGFLEQNSRKTREEVVVGLQKIGFAAALCKCKWERSGKFPAGEHEYIDIVIGGRNGENRGGKRYYVDMGFPGQFQIARPTKNYRRLSEILPNIFVGGNEKLKQVVDIMCRAAKASLKKEGMPLPPWRGRKFMLSNWFGPVTRVSSISSSSDSSVPAASSSSKSKQRPSEDENLQKRVADVSYAVVKCRTNSSRPVMATSSSALSRALLLQAKG